MKVSTVLSFKGDCEAAFKFYEQHLGGQPGPIFRYAGSPMADSVPPEWRDKIMHGSIVVGDHLLMGGDVADEGQYDAPKGFSLSLQISDTAEAERIYNALVPNGTVLMPLEKTFWAALFGSVVDRFGIPWLINCE
jgi:PhnB protein